MSRTDVRGSSSANSPVFLALGCVGFIASAAPAFAQAQAPAETQQGGEQPRLGGVVVTGTAIDEDGLKVENVESPKATAPLLDTPQTITVISSQTIRKQNLLTLRDVLTTIPGITFGAGEGGGGYGDSINLRGYSANNDITQDGVRDSAQYSRTDPFNLQQVEVYNGANSVFNGSGSVGGTINLVSKTPQAEDLTIVQAAIGTNDYYRGTIDTNMRLSESVAIRLNAMAHKNDYAGRDVESFKRWGIAPSIKVGVDGPTSATLSYVHQEDDNVPLYGVPYYRNAFNNGPLAEADDSDYFGFRNLDQQDIQLDRVTFTLDHDFSDKVSIRYLSRWQRVDQPTVTSAPQGTYCLSSGLLGTGAPCPADVTPGTYLPSGPRGLVRNQNNETFYNQLDLRANFDTGGISHALVVGASFTEEDYVIESGQLARNPGGALPNPTFPLDSISNPTSVYSGPVNYVRTGISDGETSNKAIYLFDTASLNEKLEFNFGLRYENAKGEFRADTYATPATGGAVTRGPRQVSDENLFSYRFGLVFKPVETVSLYAAYGNSRTPTSATVRLGCGVPITGPGGIADPCDVPPEKAVNYEIGAKANVLDGRLQLTAALFRNERTNYRVASQDSIFPTLSVNDGRARVDGVALGASGNITDAWAVFANYTYLHSKVLQSVSDSCLAMPRTECANSAAFPDPQRGDALVQTPKHSGSLFTTYTFPFGLQIGYGATYQGSFALNQSALVAGVLSPVFRSDDYLTHRAFASYTISDGITAQVNVQNLTNERYFTNIRNNGWALPGEGRSATLSLFYSF